MSRALGLLLGLPGWGRGNVSYQAPTPPLIAITHNGGSLAEYTASVTDGGRLAVSASAAMAGSANGMSAQINTSTPIYAYKSLAAPNTSGIVRYRFYLDPNGAVFPINQPGGAPGGEIAVAMITDIASNPVSLLLLGVDNSSQYVLYGVCPIDPSGTHVNTDMFVITDAPHCIEVETKRATTNISSDGYTRFWVDDVLALSTLFVDNYDWFNDWQLLIMGPSSGWDTGTSGTIYLDEIAVNDSGAHIGPVA